MLLAGATGDEAEHPATKIVSNTRIPSLTAASPSPFPFSPLPGAGPGRDPGDPRDHGEGKLGALAAKIGNPNFGDCMAMLERLGHIAPATRQGKAGRGQRGVAEAPIGRRSAVTAEWGVDEK